MCGIAGVLSFGQELDRADRRDVEAMTGVLRHRGPDGTGLHAAARCILGNTRLAIMDPSDAAALPMASDDGRIVLAYNGEISNFRELKAAYELDRKFRFRSGSDTEVLLRLYEDQGIGCLSRLSGKFAFCLYDARVEKAWLVRDFYGIDPLFTMRQGGRLYFASEIKAFLELPGFDRSLDLEGLHHYFSLAYYPGEHTPFKAVRELQGGRLIECDLARGTDAERAYYTPSFRSDPALADPDVAAGRLHSVLKDSVRRHLVSDAPLGMTLSGGVDTSTLLGLAKELGQSSGMQTYSLRIGEPSFDESRYQRLMSEFAGTRHHEIRVGPGEILEDIERHLAFLDEPSGNGAAIPSFLLAREAKKRVSVLLSGEGGDEIFNAYETHGAWKVRKLYRALAPAPARAALRTLARLLPTGHSKLSLDFRIKRFVEGAELGTAEAHLYWRHVLPEPRKRALLPGLGGYRPTDSLFAEAFAAADADSDLGRLSLLDIKYFFINDLMVKNDRMMMAHAVEARFPYMDREVVEFAARLPADLKIRGFQRRWIQKRAMAGRLPPEILARSNFGLELPHSVWFFREFRAEAERWFSKASVERSGVMDHAALQALWREHLEKKADHGRALWSALMFLRWYDLFVDRRGYKRYVVPATSTLRAPACSSGSAAARG